MEENGKGDLPYIEKVVGYMTRKKRKIEEEI